jgi:hypothetical protein
MIFLNQANIAMNSEFLRQINPLNCEKIHQKIEMVCDKMASIGLLYSPTPRSNQPRTLLMNQSGKKLQL